MTDTRNVIMLESKYPRPTKHVARRVRSVGIISGAFAYMMRDVATDEIVGYGDEPDVVSGLPMADGYGGMRDLPQSDWFTVDAIEVDTSAWD